MFKFKVTEYPSCHPVLHEFREIARGTTAHSSLEPVKRIIAIGVPFGKHGYIDGNRDAHRMKACFEGIKGLNVPVSSDFTFIPLDMRYGQDFLDPGQNLKADVVFFSYIAGIDHPDRKFRFEDAFPLHFSKRPPYVFFGAPWFKTSPFDKGIQSWRDATERSEAKIAISYSLHEKDIDVRRFNSHNYVDADNLAAEGWFCIPPNACRHILIRKDYASQLAS